MVELGFKPRKPGSSTHVFNHCISKQQIVPTEIQRPLTRFEDSRGEQAQPAERSQGGTGGITSELCSSMVLAFQLPVKLLPLEILPSP